MRPEKSDYKLVWDMLEAARTVVELTGELDLAAYERNKTIRLAVERSIEIIGEAARHRSPEFLHRHNDIPWEAIVRTRHVMAHDYGEIEHDKVWRIATTHIPALVLRLQPILDANPPGAPSPQ